MRCAATNEPGFRVIRDAEKFLPEGVWECGFPWYSDEQKFSGFRALGLSPCTILISVSTTTINDHSVAHDIRGIQRSQI